MSIHNTELSLKNSTNLYSRFAFEKNRRDNVPVGEQAIDNEFSGKILHDGKIAWIAKGNTLDIMCLKSGNKLAMFNFDDYNKTHSYFISNVQELNAGRLVIILLNKTNLGGTIIAIVSINGSNVQNLIELPYDRITSCSYITNSCFSNVLQNFGQYLVVGTDRGNLILLDLYLESENNNCLRYQDNSQVEFVEIAEIASLSPEELEQLHRVTRKYKKHFGIQLDVLETPCAITSILQIRKHSTLALGFCDGNMVLYDLETFAAYHLAYPPEEKTPLVDLIFLDPIEDPRPCIYIWAFHASRKGAIAVMHSVMFSRRFEKYEEYSYNNFQSCTVCLTMPFYNLESIPLSLQSITKKINQGQEELSLCVMSWASADKSTTILLFDLNQWYKEQMPSLCDWKEAPNYTLIFSLPDNEEMPIQYWLDVNSIVPFNSIQRPEEHFYPNSLSFDVKCLTSIKSSTYYWSGIQNKALELLNSGGPICILNPNEWYKDMLHVALIPQFIDHSLSYNVSIESKREFLLSIALEYNITDLLKKCAILWSDGSQLGQDPYEGVSLSTLTNWIFKRAQDLKKNSNRLCIPLFDLSGREIDSGTQNNLKHCSRQLKILAEVMEMVLKQCMENIPENVFEVLKSHSRSIKMASDYQEVLQWLLNVGILPEGIYTSDSLKNFNDSNRLDNRGDFNEEFQIVPYPYQIIKTFYQKQRSKLSDGSGHHNINVPSKYLFIDMFIKHECKQNNLKELGIDVDGSDTYPPSSLQAILRILLLPNISFENKYILLTYLFLDINSILSDSRYSSTVQNLIKFPTVFRLNPSIIKRTQAFWFLDHDLLETAIEELISPLSHNRHLPQWQSELVIHKLLKQNSFNLALKVLQAPGTDVSPELTIQTLLSNNLTSEAFEYQRSLENDDLLRYFFEYSFKIDKSHLLLDLALNERENDLFNDFLKRSDDFSSSNLQLTYLLQRSKFFDILKLINDGSIANEYTTNSFRDILLLYHSTLGPTTKYLSSLTNHEKFQLQEDSNCPQPLSKGLISNNLDMKNAIFQKTIMNIKGVANEFYTKSENNEINNIPFLRKQVYHLPKLLNDFDDVSLKSEVVNPVPVNQKKRSRESVNTYEEDRSSHSHSILFNLDENIVLQPPMKKKRLGNSNDFRDSFPYKNISNRVIKKIKNRQPFSKTLTTSRAASRLSVTPEKSIMPASASLLHTPIVSKVYGSQSEIDRYTPHSILKSAASNISSRCSTPHGDIEAKSLKFTSPLSQTLDSSIMSFQECDDNSEDEQDKEKDLCNKLFSPSVPQSAVVPADNERNFSTYDGPKRRRSLRSNSTTPIEIDLDNSTDNNDEDVAMVTENVIERDIIPIQSSLMPMKEASIIKQQSTHTTPTKSNTQVLNTYELRSRTRTPEKMQPLVRDDPEKTVSSPAQPDAKSEKPLNRLLLEANVKKYFEEFKKKNTNSGQTNELSVEVMKKINEFVNANESIDSNVSEINNDASVLDGTGFNETFLRKYEEIRQQSNNSSYNESTEFFQKTHYLSSTLDENNLEISTSKEECSAEAASEEKIEEPVQAVSDDVISIHSISGVNNAELEDDAEDVIDEEDELEDDIKAAVEDIESDNESENSYGPNINLNDDEDDEDDDDDDEEGEEEEHENDDEDEENAVDEESLLESDEESEDNENNINTDSNQSIAKSEADDDSVIAISSSDEETNVYENNSTNIVAVQQQPPSTNPLEQTDQEEPEKEEPLPTYAILENNLRPIDNSDLLYGFDDANENDEVDESGELDCAQIYDEEFEITTAVQNEVEVGDDIEEVASSSPNISECVEYDPAEPTNLTDKTLDQGFIDPNLLHIQSPRRATGEYQSETESMELDETSAMEESDTSNVFHSFTEDVGNDSFVATETVTENAVDKEEEEISIIDDDEEIKRARKSSLFLFKDLPETKNATENSSTDNVDLELNITEDESDGSLRLFKDLPSADSDKINETNNTTYESVRDAVSLKSQEPDASTSAVREVKSADNSVLLFKDLPDDTPVNVDEDLNVSDDKVEVMPEETELTARKFSIFENVPRAGSETNTDINSDSSDSRKLEIDIDEESNDNPELDAKKEDAAIVHVETESRKEQPEEENGDNEEMATREETEDDNVLAEKKVYMLRSHSMTNLSSPIDRVFQRGTSAPRNIASDQQLTPGDLPLTPKRRTRKNSNSSEQGNPLRRSTRKSSTTSIVSDIQEEEKPTMEVIVEAEGSLRSKSSTKDQESEIEEPNSTTKRIRTRSISKSVDVSDAESDISIVSNVSSTTKRLRTRGKKSVASSSDNEAGDSESIEPVKRKRSNSNSSAKEKVSRKLINTLSQIPEESQDGSAESSSSSTAAAKSRGRGRPKKN